MTLPKYKPRPAPVNCTKCAWTGVWVKGPKGYTPCPLCKSEVVRTR